jgi:hypothetical protein
MQSEADAVIQKPGSLLGDPNGARNFITADSILAIDYLPDRGKPLIQTNGRLFIYSPGLQSELAISMASAALKAAILRLVEDIGASTLGAGYAVRPAPRYEILVAVVVVGKVDDGFLKCGGFYASICPDSYELSSN